MAHRGAGRTFARPGAVCDAYVVRLVVHATAIDAGDAPPSEFRIFRAGENAMPQACGAEGTSGVFLFTERSAAKIMDEFRRGGVDMMIDLNHESTDEISARADSKDARGWFKLEVRAGELWAVDVRWTPDGERRLAERTQRYISPTFGADRKTGEIVGLVACALVARPATLGAPALVAASKRAPMTEADKATCRAALAGIIRRELRASKQRARLGLKP